MAVLYRKPHYSEAHEVELYLISKSVFECDHAYEDDTSSNVTRPDFLLKHADNHY